MSYLPFPKARRFFSPNPFETIQDGRAKSLGSTASSDHRGLHDRKRMTPHLGQQSLTSMCLLSLLAPSHLDPARYRLANLVEEEREEGASTHRGCRMHL